MAHKLQDLFHRVEKIKKISTLRRHHIVSETNKVPINWLTDSYLEENDVYMKTNISSRIQIVI